MPQGFLLPFQEEGLECVGQLHGHIDSPALAALGRGELPEKQGMPHLVESAVEVDVGPLEGEQFSEPQPGSDGAQEQRIAAEASTAPAAAARATPPNTPTPPSETR